jgi:DNA-binding transcriptional LysR family regulator
MVALRGKEDDVIEEISGDFLQWLRGFSFVAEKGSVRKAAIAMGREQPTISRQIHCLEKELGVTLFDRSSGKMKITPEGKALQEEAVSLFEDVKRIKGQFTEQEFDYRGKIVIATTHATIDAILPPFVADFWRQHPGVTFHFEGGIREMVYEKVESAEADFGLASFDTSSKTIVFHDLYEASLVLIAPKHNRFFAGNYPTLEQIAETPLILFAHRGSVEPLIEGRFAEERLKLNMIMTHNNFVSIKKYVAHGMGVAILGSHGLSPEDEQNFDIYSLDRYFPKRRYGIILKKKKYHSAMVKAFIRSIKPDIDFSAKTERDDKVPPVSLSEFMRARWAPKQAEAFGEKGPKGKKR